MTAPDTDALLVEVITDADDFPEAFHCISEAFGTQTHDAIWCAFNPGWDTPEGQAAGAANLLKRWQSTTADVKGNPKTVFLKATLPAPNPDTGPGQAQTGSGRRRIVGVAIWEQVSAVEGHGNLIPATLRDAMDLEARYPGNETEQRFLAQMWRELLKTRRAFVAAKAAAAAAAAEPPAILALDLCATHPAFQRRGAASRLVQWGLEEGRRRGIPDATTEASAMGRHVYARMGFRPVGTDIVYELDEEFADRDRPPNLFMHYSHSFE
ncbi:acyl-CoA N-acyltransferase [Nemania sp. FL0031]|nr:acyl-CoA N-acyltransferase [Nemania sp. FL0031]